jgi:cytochrome c oxidase assembly protein subunit 15
MSVVALRSRPLSLRTFRWAAALALVSLFLVVVTGATVRLTGSGLGCENWPRCGDTVLPAKDFNVYVEFGNRVVGFGVGLATLFAAWAAWRAGVRGGLLAAALGLPFLVLAQGILGGITVLFELHPLIVMGHFLLSLAAIALAVLVLVEADRLVRSRPPAELPRWLPLVSLALVPVALVLVVTGAFVTAAGPHSGGEDIERLGDLENAIYVHVRATAVFGVGFLVVLAALLRRRVRAPLESGVAAALLVVLLLQMIVGEVQWRSQLPWWLVLIHVVLATAVWAAVVALAALIRPAAVPAEQPAAARA